MRMESGKTDAGRERRPMRSRRARNTLRSFAVREIVIGSLIVGTVLLLVENQLRSNRAIWRGALCQSNARQVGMALFMYAADYDGKLPIQAGSLVGMVSATRPYLRDDSRFQCPETGVSAPDGPVGWLTPGRYAGLPIAAGWPDPYLHGRLAQPGDTVLLYEAETDRSPDISPAYRHSGGAICLLFSGQSFWMRDLRPNGR